MSEAISRQFQIVRNGDPLPANVDWSKGVETVQKNIAEALNARNVAFLLGAGCSSLRRGDTELGISTMQPLTGEFCAAAFNPQAAALPAEEDSDGQEGNRDEWDDAEPTGATPSPAWALSQEEMEYLNEVGIELTGEYARNLEPLMEVLHSLRFVLNRSAKPAHYARGALLTTAMGEIIKVSSGTVAHMGLCQR